MREKPHRCWLNEGLGRYEGGRLPSWMEVVDAELEAIFQYLRRQAEGARVLMLVDCTPALPLIKRALKVVLSCFF